MGQTKEHLGVAHEAIAEVSKLLDPLGPQFRRDLGLVCKSHHLNDLGGQDAFDRISFGQSN
jgi:molecular chaperone HtpG